MMPNNQRSPNAWGNQQQHAEQNQQKKHMLKQLLTTCPSIIPPSSFPIFLPPTAKLEFPRSSTVSLAPPTRLSPSSSIRPVHTHQQPVQIVASQPHPPPPPSLIHQHHPHHHSSQHQQFSSTTPAYYPQHTHQTVTPLPTYAINHASQQPIQQQQVLPQHHSYSYFSSPSSIGQQQQLQHHMNNHNNVLALEQTIKQLLMEKEEYEREKQTLLADKANTLQRIDSLEKQVYSLRKQISNEIWQKQLQSPNNNINNSSNMNQNIHDNAHSNNRIDNGDKGEVNDGDNEEEVIEIESDCEMSNQHDEGKHQKQRNQRHVVHGKTHYKDHVETTHHRNHRSSTHSNSKEGSNSRNGSSSREFDDDRTMISTGRIRKLDTTRLVNDLMRQNDDPFLMMKKTMLELDSIPALSSLSSLSSSLDASSSKDRETKKPKSKNYRRNRHLSSGDSSDENDDEDDDDYVDGADHDDDNDSIIRSLNIGRHTRMRHRTLIHQSLTKPNQRTRKVTLTSRSSDRKKAALKLRTNFAISYRFNKKRNKRIGRRPTSIKNYLLGPSNLVNRHQKRAVSRIFLARNMIGRWNNSTTTTTEDHHKEVKHHRAKNVFRFATPVKHSGADQKIDATSDDAGLPVSSVSDSDKEGDHVNVTLQHQEREHSVSTSIHPSNKSNPIAQHQESLDTLPPASQNITRRKISLASSSASDEAVTKAKPPRIQLGNPNRRVQPRNIRSTTGHSSPNQTTSKSGTTKRSHSQLSSSSSSPPSSSALPFFAEDRTSRKVARRMSDTLISSMEKAIPSRASPRSSPSNAQPPLLVDSKHNIKIMNRVESAESPSPTMSQMLGVDFGALPQPSTSSIGSNSARAKIPVKKDRFAHLFDDSDGEGESDDSSSRSTNKKDDSRTTTDSLWQFQQPSVSSPASSIPLYSSLSSSDTMMNRSQVRTDAQSSQKSIYDMADEIFGC